MLHGRPVAILGGVRIPFCKQNTAYADVGNLGMSVRTLGALVEKYGLHGQQLGEVALGAVIKHSSDWNLGREATLSSGLSPLTPGITLQRACGTSLDSIVYIANKIATGQPSAGGSPTGTCQWTTRGITLVLPVHRVSLWCEQWMASPSSSQREPS